MITYLGCAEDVWKPHRRLLTPSFHSKILESSLEIMERNAIILCEQLRSQVDADEFDILPYVEQCSLDIICGKLWAVFSWYATRWENGIRNWKLIFLSPNGYSRIMAGRILSIIHNKLPPFSLSWLGPSSSLLPPPPSSQTSGISTQKCVIELWWIVLSILRFVFPSFEDTTQNLSGRGETRYLIPLLLISVSVTRNELCSAYVISSNYGAPLH